MTKRKSKSVDVAKFGGVDELGSTKLGRKDSLDGTKDTYELNSVETQSQTKLEDDIGEGNAVVLRAFKFQIDITKPEVFLRNRPTKQDLFNSHARGIETSLWRDGLKIEDGIPPRLEFDATHMCYTIFVSARPRKGYLLQERPQTLTEIAHGL